MTRGRALCVRVAYDKGITLRAVSDVLYDHVRGLRVNVTDYLRVSQ